MRTAQSIEAGDSLIGQYRAAERVLRATAAVVLFFFLWLNVHPAIAAIKDEAERQQAKAQAERLDAADTAQTLDELREQLKAIAGKGKGHAFKEERAALKALRKALKDQEADIRAGFERDRAHIDEHGLPDVIRERHREAVAQYEQNQQKILSGIDALDEVQDDVLPDAANNLQAELDRIQPRRPSTFDPDKLPFRVPDSEVREPRLNEQDLRDLFNPNLARLEAPLRETPARKHEISRQALARLDDETSFAEYRALQRAGTEVASLSASGILATAAVPVPGPEFLAATEDVQITDAIRQKAQELNNSPVEIYNWVRNSIEYIPTYGSIQGSDMTLHARRGNAFDTASLLIALLRAAGTPARYVYGVIELPAAKAMNWAGGLQSADATQTLLATGGIPNGALTSAGKTVAIRLEHVWVEAFVDYYPSRAAKNLAPDAWVPMDASFKQYDYSDGMELQQNVPLDAETFLGAAQQGATINEDQGWVQNLNQSNIQSQLTAYQQQLQSYIENQNPDATVGDVLGAKTIQVSSLPHLAASLPYRVVARGSAAAALPDRLQHKFRYRLYTDAYQRALDSWLFDYQIETVKIAGKKLTMAYVPSTDADRQTLESYLPKPHADGSPIQPSEFPSQIPAYKVRVKPQLRVEGQVVASGGSFTLGTELLGEGGFTTMDLRTWDLTLDDHIAGQTGALGVSLQGISAHQLEVLQQRLQDTQQKLQVNELETLTGEHLSGDLLAATVWSYFASVESFGRIAQRQANMIDTPGLSYGFFYGQTVPITRYGVVMSVKFPGVLMDIGHQRRIAFSKANDHSAWISYNRLRGQHSSAMEHAIPERFFDNPNDSVTPQGVSAVKMLAVAAAQGQRIYTLTQANQSQLSSIQQSADVMDNIRAALNAGKEVTIHQSAISYAGFRGAGYVITDPQTGAGAYLIEGGASGGVQAFVQGFGTGFFAGVLLKAGLSAATFTAIALPHLAVLGVVLIAVSALVIAYAIRESYLRYQEHGFDVPYACFVGGFISGFISGLVPASGALEWFSRFFLTFFSTITWGGSGALGCTVSDAGDLF